MSTTRLPWRRRWTHGASLTLGLLLAGACNSSDKSTNTKPGDPGEKPAPTTEDNPVENSPALASDEVEPPPINVAAETCTTDPDSHPPCVKEPGE